MALIPLEDNFADVINKAQRGRKITDEKLAAAAGISLEDLHAIQSGKPMISVLRRVARHLRLSPDALEELANHTWYPKLPLFARGFAMFNTPYDEGLTVNSYLIWDSRSKVAAAFDTGTDCGDMLSVIESEKLRLQYILLTHTHSDHVADAKRLAAATKAEIYSHEAEPLDLPGARTFKDNAHFHLAGIAVKANHTPGHSPGLTSYFVTGLSHPIAFVGDAIFCCSMGGSEEHFTQQYHNNVERILTLPKETVIAPGHGPLTTLVQEKEHNPFFCRAG